MSWTGSTCDEPGPGCGVHRGLMAVRTEGAGARWRADRSMASGHSGARKLTGRGTTERGEHGELGRWCGDWAMVGETVEEEELGDSSARATGEGKSAVGRCGESRGSHRPFIRAGAHRRGVAGGSNGGVNGFNAIEDGARLSGGLRGGDDGGASNGSGGI
jgi:hypothetical protein